MLNLDNVSVSYGKRTVLKNISFRLKEGRFCALVGKNGSGKSTLLSAVAGAPCEGAVTLQGIPLKEYASKERAKRVALLPQHLPAAPFTVEQLAAMGRTPYRSFGGRMSGEDRAQIENALTQTGMTAFRERFLGTLSGGERQKAYLAMLLAQDAPLMLLDEPTAFMDMEYAGAFLLLLRRLQKEQQKTVLAVLHDLNVALEIADDILLLDGGEQKFFGTAEEFVQSGLIEAVLHLHPNNGVYYR